MVVNKKAVSLHHQNNNRAGGNSFNTAKIKMENTNLPIVQGEANKAQGGHYLTWECPELGVEMWCQGEFFYNTKTEEIEHIVTDEDFNELYKVVAKL